MRSDYAAERVERALERFRRTKRPPQNEVGLFVCSWQATGRQAHAASSGELSRAKRQSHMRCVERHSKYLTTHKKLSQEMAEFFICRSTCSRSRVLSNRELGRGTRGRSLDRLGTGRNCNARRESHHTCDRDVLTVTNDHLPHPRVHRHHPCAP